MKKTLLLATAILMVLASMASAQTGGRVELFADADGTDCAILDTAPGVVTVHMVLVGATEVGAVEFGAPVPECWTGAVWLEDNIPWPVHIGDSQLNEPSGLSIAFLSEVTCGQSNSPIYLGSISYSTQGAAPPCCYYPVVKAADAHPEFDTPIAVKCTDYLFGVEAGGAWINPDETCSCTGQMPLPVHDTSWGRVKALYNK